MPIRFHKWVVTSVGSFQPISFYSKVDLGYQLLPFRFTALDSARVVMTNMAGEFYIASREVVADLVHHLLDADSQAYLDLRTRGFLVDSKTRTAMDTLPIKIRSRLSNLPSFTALHLFVVTLRCEHSCPYCQVSRQSESKVDFDMTEEIADKAIDLMFQSPSEILKVEFQGGEPLLNFPLIKYVVERCLVKITIKSNRKLNFVITTNLALINDEIIDFCKLHKVDISTSLDGPSDLHNKNRPRPGNNSYELTVEGVNRLRRVMGPNCVSALMTTTNHSLKRVKDIIDEYIKLGFNNIFLRALSPHGFAIKTKMYQKYKNEEWLEFYKQGLLYIIEINKNGYDFIESYAQIILKKMLTFEPTGYVDLMSPAGVGIAAVVYNYDGEVYASDESRMLAEIGDKKFMLGNVLTDSYEQIFIGDTLLETVEDSFTKSTPLCEECAFEDYCGADPVYHYATQGDIIGHKARSGFCSKNMSIFRFLLDLIDKDPETYKIFRRWALR